MQHTAYLSLGSNLGDRRANLDTAIQRLAAIGDIVVVSSIYETEPMEVTDQPWFLNCALSLRTAVSAGELLTFMLRVEKEMGRVRTQPKGPRLIDLDILLFDDLVSHSPRLRVPHPALHERRFVLQPLAEIAPLARHPVLNRTIEELLQALPAGDAQVRRIG